MELRHNGAWYHISPWGLSWDDENYYLVGYDSDAEKIKHYRVDKMLHIRLSSENREGKEFFNKDNFLLLKYLEVMKNCSIKKLYCLLTTMEEIECSVRISWGPDTSENELKENLVKLLEIAKQIKG